MLVSCCTAHLVGALDRPPHDVDLVLDLLVDLVDRRLQLLHLRKRRLVDPQLVLVLDLQLRPLLLQRRTDLLSSTCGADSGLVLNSLVQRLGPQPLLLGLVAAAL